jgi:hypothetical protein
MKSVPGLCQALLRQLDEGKNVAGDGRQGLSSQYTILSHRSRYQYCTLGGRSWRVCYSSTALQACLFTKDISSAAWVGKFLISVSMTPFSF